jgi:hypothetical protein
MLVYCNGFWSGFKENTDGINFSFFKYIFEKVFNEEIILSDFIEQSDILLESFFGTSQLSAKKWKYSIFFSGEGLRGLPENYQQYTIILGSIDSGKNFISCPLFLAYEFCKPFNYPKQVTNVPQKDILCTISTNHEHTENIRAKIIEELEKRGFHIDFAAKYKNNVGHTIPGAWHNNEIIEYQKNYKLIIAFENSKHQHYITEKIINPLRSGTMPIYYGTDDIDKYINSERFLNINQENIDLISTEIRRLLSDDKYWLEKVNKSIFVSPFETHITNIINKMSQIINQNDFFVEIICNPYLENNRLKTLSPLFAFFNILPNYTVWGQDALNHKYFQKFKNTTTVNASSLVINTLSTFERYKNNEKYLLVLESDCFPLQQLEYIKQKIEDTIKIMDKHNIDFCFINKGHLASVDIDNYNLYFKNENVIIDVNFKNIETYDKQIYITNASRCTEAFLVSPKGMQTYIDYFHSNENHVPLDWSFNYFFYKSGIKSAWLIPELFKQYGYQSSIPHSIL